MCGKRNDIEGTFCLLNMYCIVRGSKVRHIDHCTLYNCTIFTYALSTSLRDVVMSRPLVTRCYYIPTQLVLDKGIPQRNGELSLFFMQSIFKLELTARNISALIQTL